jgi:hypothetical protein
VDNFGALQQAVVALITEGGAGGEKEFGVVAGVRRMAGSTAVVGNDRMDTLHPFGGIVVTSRTKRAPLGDQQFTMLTPVWIMATGAAIFEGGMNHFLAFAHAVVALLTQGDTISGEFESALFAGVRDATCFVTGRTITTSDRVVQGHSFGRSQRRVTFRCHTTLCRSQGEGCHRQEADPE